MIHGLLWLPLLLAFLLLTSLGWIERRRQNLFRNWAQGAEIAKLDSSGAATSISNVGPGLGPIIGPNGDFSSLPDISKWILTVGMILGRLELFAILVLFLPSFWRN